MSESLELAQLVQHNQSQGQVTRPVQYMMFLSKDFELLIKLPEVIQEVRGTTMSLLFFFF